MADGERPVKSFDTGWPNNLCNPLAKHSFNSCNSIVLSVARTLLAVERIAIGVFIHYSLLIGHFEFQHSSSRFYNISVLQQPPNKTADLLQLPKHTANRKCPYYSIKFEKDLKCSAITLQISVGHFISIRGLWNSIYNNLINQFAVLRFYIQKCWLLLQSFKVLCIFVRVVHKQQFVKLNDGLK